MALVMEGEERIEAPIGKVWAALNDTETLKACIPGCQSLEKTSDSSFEAAAKVKVGPVGATFKGKVDLVDLDPPNGYRIVGEGQGGIAGHCIVVPGACRRLWHARSWMRHRGAPLPGGFCTWRL